MATSFLKGLIKGLPADSSIANDGKSSSEFHGYIDTGSYALNAALSGSLFGGMPNNKILALAGDPSTGKSFIALAVVKAWLDANPNGAVAYFDTESAITNQMLEARKVDLGRVAKIEPETIEQFRESALQLLDRYAETPEKDREPLFFVLDSLGNLSSSKEMADIRDSKDTKDMTKAGLLRGTFRVLRLRLSKLKVPMIATNHTYDVIGAYIPTKIMSGGKGIQYVSDSIAMLSKSKDKDKDKNVIGSIVKVKMAKSRLSKENSEVELRIAYNGGLDRYHGILEFAEAAGMVATNMGKVTFSNGTTEKATKILATPEKYFTPEFLKALDEKYVIPTFSYGIMTESEELSTSEDSE